jgi:hypothetical protein
VQKATAGEKAGLIRLFFHDYFVKVHTLEGVFHGTS